MNSPFAWPGGKRALKTTLLRLLPEHGIYVEVFAGSAKLLFGKEPSKFEVMNDINGEVTNFFRVAKHRPAELAERFEIECVHAGRFRELRETGAPACELDRALRFAYLVWYSFSAKGEHFASMNVKGLRRPRAIQRIRETLQQTAARLAGVQIEQRDCVEIITRYDSRETFFYLDPPYVHYQANGRYEPLAEEHRATLFAMLSKIKGKFLMSFDDCAEVRQLARKHRFQVEGVDVGYSINGARRSNAPKAKEVLIANYSIASLLTN